MYHECRKLAKRGQNTESLQKVYEMVVMRTRRRKYGKADKILLSHERTVAVNPSKSIFFGKADETITGTDVTKCLTKLNEDAGKELQDRDREVPESNKPFEAMRKQYCDNLRKERAKSE